MPIHIDWGDCLITLWDTDPQSAKKIAEEILAVSGKVQPQQTLPNALPDFVTRSIKKMLGDNSLPRKLPSDIPLDAYLAAVSLVLIQ